MARWWPQTRRSIRELPELAHVPEPDRQRAFASVADRVEGSYREVVLWMSVLVAIVVADVVVPATSLISLGWYGAVLGAVVASVGLAQRLRKDRAVLRVLRRANGFCVRCGYDLRATPGRCPECGTIPAEAKANAKAPASQGPPSDVDDRDA